jgi:hypothetical protein
MSEFSLDRFLESCDARGALRLRAECGGRTGDFVLPQPFAVVGTDARADVRVAGQLASRAAYLQLVEGRLLCLDFAAGVAGRAGNYPPHGWLDPGKTWSCGPVNLTLVGETGATSRPRSEVAPAVVEIAGGNGGACRYRVRSPVVLIGRSSQCQVRLRDQTVSQFHCALVNTRAGLWCVDLFGRGGVTVNGATARAARLDEGDLLRVGTFSFRPVPANSTDLVQRKADGGGQELVSVPEVAPLAMPTLSSTDGGQLVTLLTVLQQQMAEQFRLTVGAVLESFGKMHAEQMRLVWQELAEIRRLTDEVNSLKASMAQRSAVSRPELAQSTRPALPSSDPWALKPPVTDRPPTAPPVTVGPTSDHKPATGEVAVDPRPAQDVDVHDWVTSRIAEVQRERDGRWQKVVKFFTGSPT